MRAARVPAQRSRDDLGDGDVEVWENAARDAARGQKAVMRKEHLDAYVTR